MKKTLALVLAIVMIFALAAPVMAENTTATATGSITIENAVAGQTYKLYRIFDLTYDAKTNSHAYTISDKWEWFIDAGPLTNCFDHDDSEPAYVTVMDGVTAADIESAAKECINNTAMYQDDPLTPDFTKTATGTTLVFDNIPLGYYLIDSSVGALCALDTTNTDIVVNEKNDIPTIDKKIKEGSEWVRFADAGYGDTVEFKVTIDVAKGAQNYVLHDLMEKGFKFNSDSVKVYYTAEGSTEKTLLSDNYYTVNTDITDIHFSTFVSGSKAPCTFEVAFKDAFYTLANGGGTVEVYYSAVYTNTNIFSASVNSAMLSYGDNNYTEVSRVQADTNPLDILKYTLDKDGNKVVLGGAEFVLSRQNNDVTEYAIFEIDENNEAIYFDDVMVTDRYRMYTLKGWTTDINQATTIVSFDKVPLTTENAGLGSDVPLFNAYANIHIVALDSGTYTITETKAPDGYNRLNEPVEVIIDGNHGVFSYGDKTGLELQDDAVEIINLTGAELPSTGGIGTTIFYIVGGLLMVGAAVVLITRRKVSAED